MKAITDYSNMAISDNIDPDISLGFVTRMSAIALSTRKVFIAYADGNSHLCGMICTVENNTITINTNQTINEDIVDYISAVKISENKIFIAYQRSTNTDYFLQSVVCTIDNDIITSGTSTQLNSETSGTEYSNVISVVLTDNKVFIAYGKTSKLGGIVCTISRNNNN